MRQDFINAADKPHSFNASQMWALRIFSSVNKLCAECSCRGEIRAMCAQEALLNLYFRYSNESTRQVLRYLEVGLLRVLSDETRNPNMTV
jgi:hypothetical protein